MQADDPTPLLQEARAHLRAGRVAAARNCLESAAARAPADPRAWGGLADLAAARGDWLECENRLARLAELAPSDAGIQVRLGVARHHGGDLAGAEAAFRHALTLAPRSADALSGLGRLALAAHRAEDAEAYLRQALACAPGHFDASVALASLFENRGEAEQAMTLLAPQVAQGHTTPELARIFAGAARQLGTPAPALQLLEQVLARGPAPRERAMLLFALAGLHDAAGDSDAAFHAAAAANRLVARGFDPDVHDRRVEALLRAFPGRVDPPAVADGDARAAPLVFIVGVPRSGTTLVERMLARHPAVLAAGEHSRLEAMAVDVEALTGQPWASAVAGLDAATLERLAADYLAPLGDIPADAAAITDKMPVNFLFLGLAAVVFPRARVLWCRRDPLDVGLSCFMQPFTGGRGVEFASDLTHIGRYIRASERLMAHWRAVLPLPVHELSYEALVRDARGRLGELLEFLGLRWHEDCLAFHRARDFVGSPSYAQVRQPLNAGAVGRHRRYAAHLAPLAAALGERTGSAARDRG